MGCGSTGDGVMHSGTGRGPLPSGDSTLEYTWRRPPSARWGKSKIEDSSMGSDSAKWRFLVSHVKLYFECRARLFRVSVV